MADAKIKIKEGSPVTIDLKDANNKDFSVTWEEADLGDKVNVKREKTGKSADL